MQPDPAAAMIAGYIAGVMREDVAPRHYAYARDVIALIPAAAPTPPPAPNAAGEGAS